MPEDSAGTHMSSLCSMCSDLDWRRCTHCLLGGTAHQWLHQLPSNPPNVVLRGCGFARCVVSQGCGARWVLSCGVVRVMRCAWGSKGGGLWGSKGGGERGNWISKPGACNISANRSSLHAAAQRVARACCMFRPCSSLHAAAQRVARACCMLCQPRVCCMLWRSA